MLLLFYFYSKKLRAEKLFITLQIRRKCLILPLCDCRTYILTGGGASVPPNVPWRAEKPIKVQSSSLLLLSVFPLCTETPQKGQETLFGEGGQWMRCKRPAFWEETNRWKKPRICLHYKKMRLDMNSLASLQNPNCLH